MTGMTDGIVIGYDGSPGSAEALRWAAREAGARGTALTVCLAWGHSLPAVHGEPAVHEPSRQRAAAVLARGVGYAESVAGPDRVRPALAGETAAQALCGFSRTAEMVVLGSRGHGRLAGSLLGPVSWQVAGHGHGRIVVIRGRWRPVNESPGPVVVGVDASAASRAALSFAFEEAALRGVPLLAVCALIDALGRLGEMHQVEEAFSDLMIAEEKEHPEVTVLRQVVAGTPRSPLLTAAAGAQMLVVGARGRGGLTGMSLGSVAQAVLHHAPCPVGIVHPATARPWPLATRR